MCAKTCEVSDFVSHLPTWGGKPRSYYISWKAPEFFWRYWSCIYQLAKYHQAVCQRFEQILQGGELSRFIDEVTIFFRADGIALDVPGDACGIHPDKSGTMTDIGNHNIDSTVQVLALHLFFSAALEEAYRLMATIEYHPVAFRGGENSAQDSYTLRRKVESMPYKLFQAVDWSNSWSSGAFVYARTWEEAEELIGNNSSGTARSFPDEPLMLWHYRRYIFEVELGELAVTRRFEVFAADPESAEELLRNDLEKRPMLAQVIGIKCLDKEGEFISPQIRDLL